MSLSGAVGIFEVEVVKYAQKLKSAITELNLLILHANVEQRLPDLDRMKAAAILIERLISRIEESKCELRQVFERTGKEELEHELWPVHTVAQLAEIEADAEETLANITAQLEIFYDRES